MIKHRFIPTPRPDVRARPARTGSRLFFGVVLAAAAAALALLPKTPSLEEDMASRFRRHRGAFSSLRDMLLSEKALSSIGNDNVNEFWLLDGQWAAPRLRGAPRPRAEVLGRAGLTQARYDSYLSLLRTVGGYRAARRVSPAAGRQVAVSLFDAEDARGGSSGKIIYSSVPLEGARGRRSGGVSWLPLGDGWYAEYDRD